jgi:succinoglycan biosynthesis transport protein ExoP
MNFRLFLAIVKTRFALIFLTLLITVGIAGVLTYLTPKKYLAATYLLFNFKEDNPFDTTILQAQLVSSYLETQLDIIRSQNVALKVVDQLEFADKPGWRQAYAQADAKAVPIRDWIAAQLITNLLVEPLPNSSHVVSVSYEAGTGADAAKIANTFAQAFITTTLELTLEPARRNAAWFDDQLKILKKRVEAAQAKVTDFQVAKGIVALDEKLAAENQRLDDISKKLIDAQINTDEVRSRQLGENHPDYISAMQRQAALTQSLGAQRHLVLQLKGQRDQLNQLASEADAEQQNYTATIQNYNKQSFQSQFNQTNIAVLSPAVQPQDPASPNILLNMISATVLGIILGIGAALGAEMINPQVRLRKEEA